jgi:alkylation response protein AidB-like acyl-CoA dehydrogenase
VRATFTQDQLDVVKTVRALAEGEAVTARSCLAAGWQAPAVDATLVRDFGLLGVPERAGGVGSPLVDLLVAVEVLGELLVPSRFVAHAAAVQLLAGSGAVAPAVLQGEQILTLAADVPGAPGWASSAPGERRRVLVPYADAADAVAVVGAEGVHIDERPELALRESLDAAFPLWDLEVTESTATAPAGDGELRASLVAAAALCGVAQGAIGLGAGYARTREQFGRVIGSFQGVAFQLAEAATARKAAWDLVLYAAWAVERGRPEAAMQVHAAKATAGRAAVHAAERCIQVHGGMGITAEADPHLYLRRALVMDSWLGRGSWHRRRAGELRIDARERRAGER